MPDEMEITIGILNELLVAETSGVAPRLEEISPYVPPDALNLGEQMRRMCAERLRNAESLTNEILRLRGVPEPRRADASTTSLHYLNVRFLLPRVLTEQRRIADLYEAALRRMPAPTGDSAALVREFYAGHRESLAALERVTASTGTRAPA